MELITDCLPARIQALHIGVAVHFANVVSNGAEVVGMGAEWVKSYRNSSEVVGSPMERFTH